MNPDLPFKTGGTWRVPIWWILFVSIVFGLHFRPAPAVNWPRTDPVLKGTSGQVHSRHYDITGFASYDSMLNGTGGQISP